MTAFTYHIAETATGRHVAWRRAGSGPPVVLLHESPRSSVALMALGERIASRFTVFAFDTPGFGLADGLGLARPSAADFADALAETFDLLGIARAPVYGTHTGAVIAAEFGARHPARTSGLVLDGFPMFTPTEQAEYLANYVAPIHHDWEGTHLAWLWSRVKDQFTAFPWYLRADPARLPRPLAPVELMQAVVVDLLSAGDGYREAYASAFRFDPPEQLARIGVPASYVCRSDDLLFTHLDRLPPLPANAEIVRLGADRDDWGRAVGDIFARHAKGSAPPLPALSFAGTASRPSRRVVHTAAGSLGVTTYRGGEIGRALPTLLLHELPGAARGLAELARLLAAERPVVAVDLPGFGSSRLARAGDAAAIAAAVLEGVGATGVQNFDAIAIGESCSVGALLAALAGARAKTLTLVDPIPDDTATRAGLVSAFTDVAPRTDGTHLLAAWHQLRDRALWKPWTERTPAHAHRFGVDPDVPRLDAVLTEWLRGGTAGRETLAAALGGPLGPLLAPIDLKTSIVSFPGHPWHDAARRLAEAARLRHVAATEDWGPIAAAIRSCR